MVSVAQEIQELRKNLTARRAEQFRLLVELIQTDTANPPGNGQASAELLLETLKNLGFEAERFDPPSNLTETMGLESAPSIVGHWSGGDGPTLCLAAGVDTAVNTSNAATGRLSGDIKDGIIHGDGAAIQKPSAVAFIYGALAAIETIPLIGTVQLVLTHDSASGGYVGSKWLLDEGIIAPDMAIVSGPGDAILTHHSGIIHFSVAISVKSEAPDNDSDALAVAHDVMAALYQADKTLKAKVSPIESVGSPGLIVGAIESGSRADQAPREATLWIGRRYLPDEDPAKVRQSVSTIIGKAMIGRKGVQCRVRPLMTDAALAASPKTRPIAAAILKAANETLKQRIPVRGSPVPTEARFFAAADIPVVAFGCGTKSVRSKNPIESLPLDSLRSSTEMIALTVGSLLAPKEDAVS